MREQAAGIPHLRQDKVQLAPELAAGQDTQLPGDNPVAAERLDIHTLQLPLPAGSGQHWHQHRSRMLGWRMHVSFGHGSVLEQARYHAEAHWVLQERLKQCELEVFVDVVILVVADRSPLDPEAGSFPAELPFKLLDGLP